MDASERASLEARIRAHAAAGDTKRAATALVEGYGRELLSFLIAHMRDPDAAADVFAQFTEDLWRGIDAFQWKCSARVWSYTLLRHAASRYIKDARRRRQVPLSQVGPLSAFGESRTATPMAARTEAPSRAAQLRESLPPLDQTLLILRVNRKLGWKEIAQVMVYDGNIVPNAVLEKEAVRLRKRFQLAKEKLRRMAVEQGLVSTDRDR